MHRVVLQFDEEVVRAERVAQTAGQPFGLVRPPSERREERTPATPGEEDEPLGTLEERVQIEPRLPARTLHMRPRDEPAQVRVPMRVLRQHRHMTVAGEGEFGARDRLQPVGTGEPRELHRTVQPVVIGERQRGIAQFERAHRELLRPRRPIEKGIGRVRVQFDVVDAAPGGHAHGAFSGGRASTGGSPTPAAGTSDPASDRGRR